MNNRILSLDVFRGITIFTMLIVNNPGSWGHIYPVLKHAKWHGFMGTDWIFPFFIFIIGFAIPLSISSQISKGKYLLSVLGKICKRSIILFLLGFFLNLFPDFNFDTVRIPGVLQRIAVVYFFCAIFFLFLEERGILFFFGFFLLVHWFLLTQIPVPSMGEPSLEMGKNLAGWIDLTTMPNHLWVHSKTWDPEGILGTLTAISSCLFGLYYGQIFIREKEFTPYQFYFGLFLGLLLISLGFLWDIVFPINKSLWTGSYVLLNSGLALFTFLILYSLVDEPKKKNFFISEIDSSQTKEFKNIPKISISKLFWTSFESLGKHALAVFFLSSFLSKLLNIPFILNTNGKLIGLKTFLYNQYFTPYFSSYNASLVWALAYTFAWMIVINLYELKKSSNF